MNLTHRLHCVQPVELKRPSVEGLREVTIARVVFLLDLKISRPARPVVHVVGMVHQIPNVQSMRWVFGVAFTGVELGGFLVPRIFRVRIYAFSF